MGMFSARFFSFVQATSFYADLHRQAVDLLPPGDGRIWLDVGCGPGLVARLAANRGYRATGIDSDPSMIWLAAAEARRSGSSASYKVASLETLADHPQKADVVSAASLLAVIDDHASALRMLTAALSEQGKLLLIEPSERMTRKAAAASPSVRASLRDSLVLGLWARSRNPARVLNSNETCIDGYSSQCYELLEGLVNAWIIQPLRASGG